MHDNGDAVKAQLVKPGSVESKLDAYFNASCFSSPPIIGADGVGTTFGNGATGIVHGPAQANLDVALSKTFAVNWPHEESFLQFRAEFYNALNHPQFSDPTTTLPHPRSA